jgi:hypothetical protein
MLPSSTDHLIVDFSSSSREGPKVPNPHSPADLGKPKSSLLEEVVNFWIVVLDHFEAQIPQCLVKEQQLSCLHRAQTQVGRAASRAPVLITHRHRLLRQITSVQAPITAAAASSTRLRLSDAGRLGHGFGRRLWPPGLLRLSMAMRRRDNDHWAPGVSNTGAADRTKYRGGDTTSATATNDKHLGSFRSLDQRVGRTHLDQATFDLDSATGGQCQILLQCLMCGVFHFGHWHPDIRVGRGRTVVPGMDNGAAKMP